MPRSAPVASQAVRSEWLRRVEEEYRSASIAQHLTLWLMQIGASPDLVRAGLRIAADELTHAEMSHATFRAAGGDGGPALVRESLGLRRNAADPLEHDVIRVGLRVFCLGETVAVPLFKALRSGCTVPVARRALDRILRDEVRHRDFGWLLLDWMLGLPHAPVLRSIARRELPAFFASVRGCYAAGVKPRRDIDPADRAWGLMPPVEYAAAVERALARDWIPRFSRRGIDARVAWDARR